jgi:hypothetical protein
MKKLKFIDLSDNPIETVRDVLEGLMSLPALRELKINFNDESEESLLLQALPKLQVLNGNKLGQDEESRTSNRSRML